MAKLTSYQNVLLDELRSRVEIILPDCRTIAERNSELLFFLEQVSSIIGGFDIGSYHKASGIPLRNYDTKNAKVIAELISQSSLPASVALSILSTERLEEIDQKNKGVYYTDYRLADMMASTLASKYISITKSNKRIPTIIDPACGSGILLCTFLERMKFFRSLDDIISYSIYAADISAHAVRAILLSIASNTKSNAAINNLSKHILQIDSLIGKHQLLAADCSGGFDFVIGNPPWEKLKLTRHEFDLSNGVERHYGMETTKLSQKKEVAFTKRKGQLKEYSDKFESSNGETKGEKDLYMIFLKLGLDLLKENGEMVQLVPASFIRNQQTTQLRKTLVAQSEALSITLFDNKARYFEIDSRFKFVMIHSRKGHNMQNITFRTHHQKSEPTAVSINLTALASIRPDISIPEIKTNVEWSLFYRLSSLFPSFGTPDSIWAHSYCREIDMTLDKQLFLKGSASGGIPILEGRMIHQYATGVKAYISGTGRQAVWVQSPFNTPELLRSQFYVDQRKIHVTRNIYKWRAGFCDITGQTNERTMLCAYIPPNCICGNKVPTIEFAYEEHFEGLSLLWVAIANSFVFDWLIRKVITTNANFFIVDSMPVPAVDFTDARCVRIIQLARELIFSHQMQYGWETAVLRGEIEALVANLYQVNADELKMILSDFPIVDKLQPAINNESASTVTADLTLLQFLQINNNFNAEIPGVEERLVLHKMAGAIPFVPSQFQIQEREWPKQELERQP